MTKTIVIHPDAENNFNAKAEELINLIKIFPLKEEKKSDFPSELQIAGSITDEDIIGEIEMATSDSHGNTVARFFHFNKVKLGLSGEHYVQLRDIAEQLQSLPPVRSMLSRVFIEKTLFSWVSNKHKKLYVPSLFIDYLDTQAKDIVTTVTTWVPIANLEVQRAFPISKSEIHPFSESIMDKWASKLIPPPHKNNEKIVQYFDSLRKEFQGLAAIVTTTRSEPEYASEYALEEALKITAILGIFSDATLVPNIKCMSTIKGFENIEERTIFFVDDKNNFQIHSGMTKPSSARNWRLGNKEISHLREMGLDKASSLLASETLKDFKKSILNAIFLYSKSAFTSDPVEKVVYMLSSLESILLKNENEPIQHNLSERVAVFISEELTKRKQVIKTIKEVYGVRSKYLHHGHTSSELELIEEFMMYVSIFFIQLLDNTDSFKTQIEFVNAIDDHKLT